MSGIFNGCSQERKNIPCGISRNKEVPRHSLRYTFAKPGEGEGFKCGDLFTTKFWREIVVDPLHIIYFVWSLIMYCGFLYNMVAIILRICFDDVHGPDLVGMWLALDALADAIFILDMLIQTRIGFLERGFLVTDTKRLALRYIKSWRFGVDVFSIIPFDLLYFAIGVTPFLRINRLLRLFRGLEFFGLAMFHTNHPNITRLVQNILLILVIIHWNACIYMSMSRAIGLGSDEWVFPDMNDPMYRGFWKQYLVCFYWSTLALTTIDIPTPENVWAYLYCIANSLLGVLIFATIFGSVGLVIAEMKADRTEFHRKVDVVKRYLNLWDVDFELRQRVLQWFEYTWNNKQSVDDREALGILPEKLRSDILSHAHLNTLRGFKIFRKCEPGFLEDLVVKFRLQVFGPKDFIFRRGDIGKDMYIVKQGTLKIITGRRVIRIGEGEVFGELSLLNIVGNKRTADVQSVGYSEIFCVAKSDLLAVLEDYPKAKQHLSQRGKQIIKRRNTKNITLNECEEDVDDELQSILDAIGNLQRQVYNLRTMQQKTLN